MTLLGFVIRHLNAATQFGQDHDFQVLVFKKNCIPFLVGLFVQYFFDNRMRINNATASLVNPFLKENWIFLRFPDSIGRDNYFFVPGFN